MLEVLLALSLGMGLILVMFEIVESTIRSATYGRDVTRRAQRARAVLERIANDVRNSVARPGIYNLGITGDVHQLTVYTTRAREDLSAVSILDDEGNDPHDLLRVAYGSQGTGLDPENEHLQWGRITYQSGRALSHSEPESTRGRVLADEVGELMFRYSDGASWFESWDSAASGALPRVIEVTVSFPERFHAPARDEYGELADPRDREYFEFEEQPDIYRLLVAVPAGGFEEGFGTAGFRIRR